MSSSSFSLKPATLADVPALAEIGGLGFETDRHTLLKAAHPTRPYHHAAGMSGAFEYWLGLPKDRIEITKAVDDETGQILGFVCWGFRLHPQPQQPTAADSAKEEADANAKRPSSAVAPEDSENAVPPDLDAIAQLEKLTSSHLAEYQATVMPLGTRAMYTVSISVHPAHHGRGVGTALIKHGTDRADREGVFCWVHSSEAGAAMFRKCGFDVDDTLEIDLDHWANQMNIKPPSGDDEWGTYTFRYMIRQPRAAS